MKKPAILVLSSVFAVLFSCSVVHAETIRDFAVKADLTAGRTLTVIETIKYDFEDAERHGIYRVIPTSYDRNGGHYNLHLQFQDATVDGQPVAWSETGESGGEQIKIGDADRTITGLHTYVITYVTPRAINDFSDHTELYWNVTGNDWQVPVEKTSFVLQAPGAPSQIKCYTGFLGSEAEDCTATTSTSGAMFASKVPFDAGQGLTVVIGFPLGVLRPIPLSEKIQQYIIDNLWVFTPFIVLIAMFLLWRKYGKEPKGRGTVIAQYEEPRGLSPALMAALVEQRVSQKAITATILDLARRGYHKVVFKSEEKNQSWFQKLTSSSPEFFFKKIKEGDANLRPFEQIILTGLFDGSNEATVADLKGKFFKPIADARKQIFDELREKKMFGMNPSAVRAFWMMAAFGFGFFGFFAATVFGPGFVLSAILSAIIIAAFGWQMPRMTPEGAAVKEECEGFKLFLSVTEKARLEFTDAPKKTPEQFARFLPAAVAFGVEDKWADQFKGIDLQPPSYMEGPMNTWTALYMINAVSTIHQAAASTMYSPPHSQAGSGGSGFSGGGSGGGFGGGGGGSW